MVWRHRDRVPSIRSVTPPWPYPQYYQPDNSGKADIGVGGIYVDSSCTPLWFFQSLALLFTMQYPNIMDLKQRSFFVSFKSMQRLIQDAKSAIWT